MIAENGILSGSVEGSMRPSWEEAVGSGVERSVRAAEERRSGTADVEVAEFLESWIWDEE